MIPVRLVIPPAVGLLYCIHHLRKKNKALAWRNELLCSIFETRTEQLKYMVDLLEKHGVEISEFDLIILTQNI